LRARLAAIPSARRLAFLAAAWKEYERDYARYFAIAMVYYSLVALVPLFVLFLATAGLVLRFSSNAAGAKLYLLEAIEAKFGAELEATANQLFARLQEQSVLVIIISVLGLMWTATVLVGRLRLGFRAIWRYDPPIIAGSPWAVILTTLREKVIAFTIVTLGEAFLLAMLALITALEWLSSAITGVPLTRWAMGWLLAVPGSLVLVPLTFALLFMYLPPVPLRWREVWFAALLCGGAWLIATQAVALAAILFGSNVSAYSALGGVLVVMLWMSVVSQVLFYGAEICKLERIGWGTESESPLSQCEYRTKRGRR
jgi:membrane protein